MIYRFIIGFVILSLLFSCKHKQNNGNGNILDIRMSKEPENLNPILYPSAIAREINQNIFLPLADFDTKTYELTPIMIKSIPVEEVISEGPIKNGVKYTFEILPEATWDDGRPITGEDYLFTIKTILHPGSPSAALRSYYSNISDIIIDSINKKQVTVKFAKKELLSKEATITLEILPKHVYDINGILDNYTIQQFNDEKKAEALSKKDSIFASFGSVINDKKFGKSIIIGSGPYKFNTWNSNQQVILEKKNNYWGSKINNSYTQQNADKIIFHFIPDEMAALSRLKSGEIDLISGVNAKVFDQLQKDSSDFYNFQSPQLIKTYCLLINTNTELLKSKNVRQALAHLLNIDKFISAFENGNAIKTNGPVHPIKSFYNKSLKAYEFDVNKAKTLIEGDGWIDTNKNGIVDKVIKGKLIEMNLPIMVSGELGNNIALSLQSEAKKIGINIEVIKKEFSQIRKENMETGKYSLILQVNTQDLGYDDLSQRFHSRNSEVGESNYSMYKNPVLDDIIDKVNTTNNEDEKVKLYAEAQKIIHEDLPIIHLYSPRERIIISKEWEGMTNAKRPGYQANTFKFKDN